MKELESAFKNTEDLLGSMSKEIIQNAKHINALYQRIEKLEKELNAKR
jgi:septal ring factor EnvC (AmiA/AmiB activator)